MAKPTTKTQLLQAANDNFTALWALIDRFSPEQQQLTFLFVDRDKNIRDVLCHLYEWHMMLTHWYIEGCKKAKTPVIPRAGYTWRTLPAMNLVIWQDYQTISLTQAKQYLQDSHKQIIAFITENSNEVLFSKGIYKWTKTTTLGAYFIGSTSSHYNWAIKKIKQQKRLLDLQSKNS